jgi:adenine-specific DNA-methyltransferase
MTPEGNKMEQLTKEDGQSMDIVEQNIDQLKELFPDVFSEGKIQFDKLQALLGEHVTDEEDNYNFSWHGKLKAGRLAQTPSTGTLRPCKDESVDWDNTQNLFIEGDNLEVLKLLQKSYHRQVKMIYIDPPYNTGNDFVYKDDFKDGVKNYLEMTGQLDGEGKKSGTNSNSAGRYHTNWLNMMYPRLKLARNLLRDDGVLAIHIDEHEFLNLTKLLDEIFGEENNIGPIVWDKKNPKGDSTKIATQHEYIVLYSKNFERLVASSPLKRIKKNAKMMLGKADQFFKNNNNIEDVNVAYREWLKKQKISGGEAAYDKIDESGSVYQSVSMAWPNKQQAPDDYLVPLKHPRTGVDCPLPARGWRNPSNTMKDLLEKGEVLFGKDETTQPRRKYILSENMEENIPSIFPFAGSDDALLKKIDIPFDNPKPVVFVQEILRNILKKDDLVIDFFAGSGTTAHACFNLNSEGLKTNRFILVQLPEPILETKKEQKIAYNFCKVNGFRKNIAEISKERIRRSAKKIQEEYPEYKGDLGFKVFKLDSSNIKRWEADFDTLEKDLIAGADYLEQGRSSEDILYELLLKYGLDLTVPIETRTIAGKTVYSIGLGALVVCLDKDVSMDLVNGVGELKEELQPEIMRVVFTDNGFKDDVVKTNAMQTLKRYGIEDIKSL